MDIHSLHVEHAVLLAVYTLLTLVNARMHKGILGIHWFSVYNALLFVGALLVAMRGHIPNTLSIVGGNLFVVVGYVVLFVCLARFFGVKLKELYVQLAFATAGFASMLQFGWLHPDTNKRLLAYSIVLCLQQLHIALFTARKERRDTHAAVSIAFMLGGLALMNLWRITSLLAQAIPQDYLKVQGGLVWMVLINTSLQCGAIVSYVWMTASLLRGNLAVQALTDPLTGLLNRRAMDGAAEKVLGSAVVGQPAAAIVIDLNDFKLINDSFGHGCGDAVLVSVARQLELGLRHSDFIGRMGGDEFIAILPQSSVGAAREIAVSLDRAIRSISIPSNGRIVRVSASFGCAETTGSGETLSDLIVLCDKALYQAKSDRRQADRSGLRLARPASGVQA
jgi:diguanylate cyclase (GGDEF)-like protein